MTPYSPPLKLWLPLIVGAVMVLSGGVLAVAEYADRRAELEEDATQYVSREMERLRKEVEYDMRTGDLLRVERAISSAGADRDIDYLILTDDKDRIIYASRPAWKGRRAADIAGGELDHYRRGRTGEPLHIHFDAGQQILNSCVAVDMPPGGKELRQHGTLCMQYDMASEERVLAHQLMRRLLFYGIGIVAVSLLLYIFLYRWVTRPLRAVSRGTEEIGRGNLGLRISIGGGGEFSQLAASVNAMAGSLAETQQNLQKLSIAVEQAGEAVMITDVEGRIEYVNPAFEKVTGYAAAEVLGKRPSLLNSGRQSIRFYQQFWDAIRSGRKWSGKIVDRRKDGSLYPAYMSVSPIYAAGGAITHYIAIQQDMSDYETLEENFRRAQKMEAVGTLVGGIAHDFNNILAGITGKLFLAKRLAGDNAELHRHIDGINTLSMRAAEIVRQLLTFARRGEAEMGPVSVQSFLDQSMKLLHLSVPENVQLILEAEAPQAIVRADVTQLQQVLINLINNARDAVEDVASPQITIGLEQIPVDGVPDVVRQAGVKGALAHLYVRDNGCGIAGEDLPHVFEPFYSTKAVGEGSGLGLSMVYGAVEAHGGVIDIESAKGEGTTVHIWLPLSREPAPGEAEQVGEADEGHGEMILLVDDEEAIRETTRDALRALGYRVATAANGIEALAHFSRQPETVDLVLTDIVMPRMGGAALAREVWERMPTLPVIFLTGYDSNRETMSGLVESANAAVLSKPLSIEELSTHIRRLLAQRRAQNGDLQQGGEADSDGDS